MPHYNIDLRFAAPVLNSILIYLINYYSIAETKASQILFWDYFIHDQHRWLYILLAFFLLVFIISIKLTISVTVIAEPIMLRFGDFNLSVPLIFLTMASFLSPPQILWYAYLSILLFIWISPLPNHVFEKIMSWLQQIRPIFILVTQQEDDHLQAPVHQYFDFGDEENGDENFEINVIFGHA